MEEKEYENHLFNKLLPKLFKDDDVITNIQKESFDYFIHHRLQRIIDEEPMIDVYLDNMNHIQVIFSQVYVDYPYIVDEKRQIKYITPNEARIRELTYSSSVSIDVVIKEFTNHELKSEKVFRKIGIARIPMMINTSKCNLYNKTPQQRCVLGECQNDTGGYFIIRGKERVLITQERGNLNHVYIFKQKSSIKYSHTAEIRSTSEENGHSIMIQMRLYPVTHRITIVLPFFNQEISLASIFLIFGYGESDIDQLLQTLILNNDTHQISVILRKIKREMNIIGSSEKALQETSNYIVHSMIKENRPEYISSILNIDMFPHLGITSTVLDKVRFLVFMLNKLLQTYIGHRAQDDRDHLNNKRFETAGYLVSELFRALYKRLVRTIEPQIQKKHDISTILNRTSLITQGLKTCFATGNWGIPKSNYIRCGVSQILSRLSYNSTISHLRRILIPIGKEGKNSKIRQIHSSQYGFICPSETPEGHSAGVVKNFTLFSCVSTRMDSSHLHNLLEMHFKDLFLDDGNTFLLLNGRIINMVNDVQQFIQRFYEYKKSKLFPFSVSISYDEALQTLYIYSDDGRVLRPLWNLREYDWDSISYHVKQCKWSWGKLVDHNIIVYVDSYQLENSLVAMKIRDITPKHDYAEIHPSFMFAICTHLIPYVDHIQAPRITYQGSMGKQAIGVYASNNEVRCDTVVHCLQYPEKPIVHTHFSELLGYDKLPSGNNLIVAIACYGGYNQEDSVIFNQSSIDRGVFRCFTYRSIMTEEKKRNNNSHEIIELPDKSIQNSVYNYSKLNSRGIIDVGTYVGPNDVIIGKTVFTHKKGITQKSDNSVVIRNGEEGYIDRIFESITPDGYLMIKVKIRYLRIPEIGDKTASRSAQKGTIGMILRQEDMPFTSEGIVPDIIINPHSQPSRMTINQLLECVAAKGAVINGKYVYSTPFSQHSHDVVETLTNDLFASGYERYGNETMYNGLTGEMFKTKIFIGPTYYQRLKHLVGCKIHARDHGSVQSLVRQPLEGRSKEGGLRFGEMERDCMISHGVSRFLNERLFDLSDSFQILICRSCGCIPNQASRCCYCDKEDTIYLVNMPYACKLLFQELMAIGLKIHFRLTDN
jgi:DNA-directed RNA polymerase II subunit RPB2